MKYVDVTGLRSKEQNLHPFLTEAERRFKWKKE